jgi:hypothetical protein
MQPHKRRRSGPVLYDDMSFLEYLDTAFAEYTPDLFLETWMPDEVRRGDEAFSISNLEEYNTGPMATLSAHMVPCMDPRTRGTAACRYKHLRVHAVDPRVRDDRTRLPLERLLDVLQDQDETGVGISQYLRWLKITYPEFTVEEVLRGVMDTAPLASITHPFCKATSRVYHEFRQLAPDTQAALATAIAQVVLCRPLPYDLPGAVLGWLQMVAVDTDMAVDLSLGRGFDVVDGVARRMGASVRVLHPLVHDDCCGLWNNWHYTARAETDIEVYAISRALKQRKDGTSARLVVMNLGYVHTAAIATMLDAANLFEAKAALTAWDKCLRLASEDRLLEEPGVDSEEEELGGGVHDVYGAPHTSGRVFWTGERQTIVVPKAPFGVHLTNPIFRPKT